MQQQQLRQQLIQAMQCPVQSLVTQDGRSAYLSAGQGKPILLLHGAGAGAVSWYPTIAALANGYRVIAPDIIGYGESEKPVGRYDRDFFIHWLADFLQQLDLPPMPVIGLSQGGALALHLALKQPQRVEKLVLINSAGLAAKPPLAALLGLLWLHARPSKLANRFYSRYLLQQPSRRLTAHAHYSNAVLKSPGGKHAFRLGRGAAVAPFTREELQDIKAETLFINAQQDRLFNIKHARQAADIMPNAKLHSLDDGGHLLHMEQPERVNSLMLDFLSPPY